MAFGKRNKAEEPKEEKQEAPVSEVEKFKRLFALSAKLDKDFGVTNTLVRMGCLKGGHVVIRNEAPSVIGCY